MEATDTNTNWITEQEAQRLVATWEEEDRDEITLALGDVDPVRLLQNALGQARDAGVSLEQVSQLVCDEYPEAWAYIQGDTSGE